MAAANTVKAKFLTETDEGKAGSQTYSGINPEASDASVASAMRILSDMQSKNVVGYQKVVTSDITE
ncbi:MAG: hypothetical protein IKU46_02215 [Peptococcaceae bacterium]|nr:hypothetical protein [Peptococcaceae bacterium]